jgi:hypothetical protein
MTRSTRREAAVPAAGVGEGTSEVTGSATNESSPGQVGTARGVRRRARWLPEQGVNRPALSLSGRI